MKLNELKTIDLTAKEWFDKVNGNSYFSRSDWPKGRLVLLYPKPVSYTHLDVYKRQAYRRFKPPVRSR